MNYQEENAKAENTGGIIAGGCGCIILAVLLVVVVFGIVMIFKGD